MHYCKLLAPTFYSEKNVVTVTSVCDRFKFESVKIAVITEFLLQFRD